MAVSTLSWELAQPVPAVEPGTEAWYGLHTQSRHEKIVVQRLQERGVTTFLPLVTEVRRWSDRWKHLELPLFSCYVFVKIMNTNEDRLKVLCTDSVFDFVGVPRQGTSIPDEQIDAIRTILEERLKWHSHPFLKVGQRVRIRSGALNGVEGILVARNGERSVVVSVDAIQRSLSVRIEGYELEAA